MKSKAAVLILNYQNTGTYAPQWSSLPNILWLKILKGFIYEGCDSFGLRNVSSKDDLRDFFIFQIGGDVEYLQCVDYSPLSVPGSVTDPENYTEKIALFALDDYTKKAISFPCFGDWYCTSDYLPSDEICFFSEGQCFMTAVPYENMVWFWNLDNEIYQALCKVDSSIPSNLKLASDLSKPYLFEAEVKN